MLNIVPATLPGDLADIKALFREYAGLVAEALCFQHFDQELAALPGAYAPPGGALLIARDADAAEVAAGCVALRRIDAATGEMKRMFVRESYRGSGLGRRLALEVIEEARRRKYSRLVLDTLPQMPEAQALYRSFGFVEIPGYYDNPLPGVVFMALALDR